MFKSLEQNELYEVKLYNKILFFSRNKLFYTKFSLCDTFQNRIILIFFHISFLLIKLRKVSQNHLYKDFSQKLFDFIFKTIELNMREIGHGDTTINKNMKSLVKTFYNILLNCEKYKNLSLKNKKMFIKKYIALIANKNSSDILGLVDYFDKYQAFCFDLSPDSVLNGDLKFNYN